MCPYSDTYAHVTLHVVVKVPSQPPPMKALAIITRDNHANTKYIQGLGVHPAFLSSLQVLSDDSQNVKAFFRCGQVRCGHGFLTGQTFSAGSCCQVLLVEKLRACSVWGGGGVSPTQGLTTPEVLFSYCLKSRLIHCEAQTYWQPFLATQQANDHPCV